MPQESSEKKEEKVEAPEKAGQKLIKLKDRYTKERGDELAKCARDKTLLDPWEAMKIIEKENKIKKLTKDPEALTGQNLSESEIDGNMRNLYNILGKDWDQEKSKEPITAEVKPQELETESAAPAPSATPEVAPSPKETKEVMETRTKVEEWVNNILKKYWALSPEELTNRNLNNKGNLLYEISLAVKQEEIALAKDLNKLNTTYTFNAQQPIKGSFNKNGIVLEDLSIWVTSLYSNKEIKDVENKETKKAFEVKKEMAKAIKQIKKNYESKEGITKYEDFSRNLEHELKTAIGNIDISQIPDNEWSKMPENTLTYPMSSLAGVRATKGNSPEIIFNEAVARAMWDKLHPPVLHEEEKEKPAVKPVELPKLFNEQLQNAFDRGLALGLHQNEPGPIEIAVQIQLRKLTNKEDILRLPTYLMTKEGIKFRFADRTKDEGPRVIIKGVTAERAKSNPDAWKDIPIVDEAGIMVEKKEEKAALPIEPEAIESKEMAKEVIRKKIGDTLAEYENMNASKFLRLFRSDTQLGTKVFLELEAYAKKLPSKDKLGLISGWHSGIRLTNTPNVNWNSDWEKIVFSEKKHEALRPKIKIFNGNLETTTDGIKAITINPYNNSRIARQAGDNFNSKFFEPVYKKLDALRQKVKTATDAEVIEEATEEIEKIRNEEVDHLLRANHAKTQIYKAVDDVFLDKNQNITPEDILSYLEAIKDPKDVIKNEPGPWIFEKSNIRFTASKTREGKFALNIDSMKDDAKTKFPKLAKAFEAKKETKT